MKERRWDIVLRVASGPMASRDPVSHRGPQVVVGTEPGPGGVVLPGGRGVAARHATFAAYDPQTMFVTPIGHNPVRVAPYAEVRWDQIEPVRDQVRLERGMAVHLGPTGQRGVTLEFVECRDLGLQAVARLSSEAVGEDLPRPPDAYEARGQLAVTNLLADVVPSRTYQAALAFLLLGAGAMLLTAAIVVLVRIGDRQGASREPRALDDIAFVVPANTALRQGWEVPMWDFVGLHNLAYARGSDVEGLDPGNPEGWDRVFYATVQQMAVERAKARHVFRRLEDPAVIEAWSKVVGMLQEARLPQVLAAIPMIESCYRPDQVSPVCAAGYWQWMPESGARFSSKEGFGAAWQVSGCQLEDGDVFTPRQQAPPAGVCPNARYAVPDPGSALGCRCIIRSCAQDFRDDIERSTRATIDAMQEVFDDVELAASGSVVQLAIASHHAGYDDRKYLPGSRRKCTNLAHAYLGWRAGRSSDVPTAHFYGDVLEQPMSAEAFRCADWMMERTRRYAPSVIADHLLAVCYYGRHHTEHEAFARWSRYAEAEDGYCSELVIPTPQEVRRIRAGGTMQCH